MGFPTGVEPWGGVPYGITIECEGSLPFVKFSFVSRWRGSVDCVIHVSWESGPPIKQSELEISYIYRIAKFSRWVVPVPVRGWK